MKSQKGFSAIEAVVVVAVLVILGFVGYRVYKAHQKATPAPTSQSTPQVKTAADLDKASSSLDSSNVDNLDGYNKSLNNASTSF